MIARLSLALWLCFVPFGPALPSSRSLASSQTTRVYLPTVLSGDPNANPEYVLVGAGDIAACDSTQDEATAKLLDVIEGTVITLGDNVYPWGTAAEFTNCYDQSWGRHKARTRPAAGNRDYVTPGASGYFGYFGAAAGEPGKGYYSYDLGAWHIIVLNSNCAAVGGCDVGSAQEQWLRTDLKQHRTACTLAYWHHPRFSSGSHGNTIAMIPFWRALYEENADVVLNGHDHHYERFAPQTPDGTADAQRGMVEFVVGTGGGGLGSIVSVRPNSEVRNITTHGVLQLRLRRSSFAWTFVPASVGMLSDAGNRACH